LTVLVAGAGMAGLAAALALRQADRSLCVTVLERSPVLSEVGAGIQLGPNAVRVLADWGLASALKACAAFPLDLQAREPVHGRVLGALPLGERAIQRYGQPYATIHRADLHRLLYRALQDEGGTDLRLGQAVALVTNDAGRPGVQSTGGECWTADVLLGCDGGRSAVREQVMADGGLHYSGDLAYRGLVPMEALPARLQQPRVTVWLAPGLHIVHYPVQAGTAMNVVAVVAAPLPAAADEWDHEAQASQLRSALGPVCEDLDWLLQAVSDWRLWPLMVREPMRGPMEHVRGRVALLGDAAHPMRPYLAQGAAMALEDAWTLGTCVAATGDCAPRDWSALLMHWAQLRWARNARVQARARRNGQIFHATGPLRWARDLGMGLLGEQLMDQPWLYAGPPAVPPCG
jgi:salicylate hydroxylase